MLLSGCGLGFILINLTLFTQNAVEKKNLGIATALLQSLRLVGGMLGTAIVGSMINWLYQHRLENALTSQKMLSDLNELSNPNVLIQHSGIADQSSPVGLAQQALLDALSFSLFAAAFLCVISLVIIWKMPPAKLFNK